MPLLITSIKSISSQPQHIPALAHFPAYPSVISDIFYPRIKRTEKTTLLHTAYPRIHNGIYLRPTQTHPRLTRRHTNVITAHSANRNIIYTFVQQAQLDKRLQHLIPRNARSQPRTPLFRPVRYQRFRSWHRTRRHRRIKLAARARAQEKRQQHRRIQRHTRRTTRRNRTPHRIQGSNNSRVRSSSRHAARKRMVDRVLGEVWKRRVGQQRECS
ncbi:hypothetical protein COCSADRAFT_261694 [Bipolaris sorokiniana ND90Pr]|uniref:Uncharacterized protein n=1 Tax=Cochliobolus sativus (strain ND90Pr / ATCC 201652) TaxID=665912 RepID=M2RUX9_COCSN|nr:uncharacterized protein COCSADRAFT_261694 [Bipolaris sorokiniana ND90Pr]EMD58923.1 hypothetical protein COCSADRAFT_261694 [Bipolaris sorokiniana ND90Pr]